MRNIMFILLALSLSAFAGDVKHDASSDAKSKDAQESMHMMKEGEGHSMISVPTVQCGNCVKTITAALDKVDGVESVKIDLDKKVAHVNYDPKKLKLADIEKAIAAAGYDANDVKRDEEAHSKLMACCQSER